MSRRRVHYEAALADYLRSRGVPYVAVDEARRAIFAGATCKSFDFLVYPPGGDTWLVDVKGRKFPYGRAGGGRYWENWVTLADLKSLHRWQEVFGRGFEALIVFAYWLQGDPDRWPTLHVHPFADRHYAFYGVPLATYCDRARERSARWQTVAMPAKAFQEAAHPVAQMIEPA